MIKFLKSQINFDSLFGRLLRVTSIDAFNVCAGQILEFSKNAKLSTGHLPNADVLIISVIFTTILSLNLSMLFHRIKDNVSDLCPVAKTNKTSSFLNNCWIVKFSLGYIFER